jgi:hypothetical protein
MQMTKEKKKKKRGNRRVESRGGAVG